GPGQARVRRRWSRVRRAQDKEPRPRLASPDGGWQRPPRLRPDKPVQLRSAGIRGWLRCQRRLAWLYPEITYLSLPGIRSTRRLANLVLAATELMLLHRHQPHTWWDAAGHVGQFTLVGVRLSRGPFPQGLHALFGITIVIDPDPAIQSAAKEMEQCCWQPRVDSRSEEHTSELQSRGHLVCRLLLEKKKKRRHCPGADLDRRANRRCHGASGM